MDAIIAIISFVFFVLAIALWSGAHIDEWEDMTAIYWEWTKDWTFSGKASTTDNWTVVTGTKGKLATET